MAKRGRASEKCHKKSGRFPHLQLGRLVSEASGLHEFWFLEEVLPVVQGFLVLRCLEFTGKRIVVIIGCT